MSLVDFDVWKCNFVPLSNDCGVMLFARQDQEVQSLYDQRRVWSLLENLDDDGQARGIIV